MPVTLVLNKGAYNTFLWNVDRSQAAAYLDKNKRLIEAFLQADVPIFAVELGNEEYLHVPKGSVLPENWNYSWLQRRLGIPQRDVRLRQEVIAIYRMYADIYHTHSELVRSFGLHAAIPMVNNSNEKWRLFNEAVRFVPAKYGVFHHYESKERGTWQSTIDSYLDAIEDQGRVPICTEWSAWFGDDGDMNLNLAGQFRTDYLKWFPSYVGRTGRVPLIMRHRLNGDPKTWKGSGTPYDIRD